MKWIFLLGIIVLMTGCYCTSVKYTPVYTPTLTYASTVAYKPVVTYRPVLTYKPVAVTRIITPVVQPNVVYSYPIGPSAVTTTTFDIY